MAKDDESSSGAEITVALAGTLPPATANGLLAITAELAAELERAGDGAPPTTWYAMVEFTVQSTRVTHETGDRQVVVRFRQIEPLRERDEVEDGAELMDRAQANRTGAHTLIPAREARRASAGDPDAANWRDQP